MLIQCTKKLLDKLNVKPGAHHSGEDALFSWHANVVTVNRRNAVVLMNDKNRYVIVLYGLRAKDFNKLDELIFDAIQKTFQEEGIKEDVIKHGICK
ncbi:DUF6933 domain-containing protein [Oceanobacillus halotolerans]|uniref:DUF6933 domain-containing protein n=1 Tax=Oceanobacillus halotolerans TaxID=2663380 RepID=UPI0013DBD09A|nr:hypothetical protein [Oceanobacillus halotolerans]